MQAMSALLCCGPCFDSQYLTEDGLIYPWLDTLLISTDDKVTEKKIFDSKEIHFILISIQNLNVIWKWIGDWKQWKNHTLRIDISFPFLLLKLLGLRFSKRHCCFIAWIESGQWSLIGVGHRSMLYSTTARGWHMLFIIGYGV